jgi:putative hydrolase of HD superfamily
MFRQPEYQAAIEGHRVRLTRTGPPMSPPANREIQPGVRSDADVVGVVQRQLDAYNARNLDGLIATYAPDAEQFLLHGECLASGHDEIRRRMATRFRETDLHAVLLNRTVMGALVVDHERVTRNFPEGRGTIEMICIYEVRDGVIRRGTFALGDKVLEPRA